MSLSIEAQEADKLSTTKLLQWAFSKLHPQIALACSFQAEESVLIDLIHRARGSDFRLFTLDTGRHNQETYDCMDAIRTCYGIAIEVFAPQTIGLQTMLRQHGQNFFYNSIEQRKLCTTACTTKAIPASVALPARGQ